MSPVAKIFVVLNLVLAVAFLGAAAAFLGWDDWNSKKRQDLQTKYDTDMTGRDAKIKELQGQKDDADRDRAAAVAEKDKHLAEVAAYRAAYDQMKKSYDELNAAAGAATRALVIAQNTIKEGRTLTDQLQQERQKLIDEYRRAEDEKRAALQAQSVAELNLTTATTVLKDAQSKLSAAETALQRTTFELTSLRKLHPGSGTGPAQPSQSARVLAADDGTNVVVISLGSEDGVQIGYRYRVSRGSQYVGEIEITHVEGRQSAGRSLRDVQKSPIQKGDDAVSK